MSPVMIVFGRVIKDFIQVLPGRYEPHNTWTEMRTDREEALRNRHMREVERLTEHTRKIPDLILGDR